MAEIRPFTAEEIDRHLEKHAHSLAALPLVARDSSGNAAADTSDQRQVQRGRRVELVGLEGVAWIGLGGPSTEAGRDALADAVDHHLRIAEVRIALARADHANTPNEILAELRPLLVKFFTPKEPEPGIYIPPGTKICPGCDGHALVDEQTGEPLGARIVADTLTETKGG